MVALEAGIAASSLSWALVQPEIAKFTRVCAYDRAGLAWSEIASCPTDSAMTPGWVDRNPAKASKVEPNPTLPFSDDEVERILEAAGRLRAFGRYGPRIEPMVLLLRYSGLRIQDAACLDRARLNEDKLASVSAEDRHPVYCPLPPFVVEKLNAAENQNSQYFFYDAVSQPESMVKSWDRVFQKVFQTADPPIQGGHHHRFRETFAVSLLLKGVSIEISKLPGTVKVTERHYPPWIKARQEFLETEIRRI